MASFTELRDRLSAHYFEGHYREALEMIEDFEPADRSQDEDVHFWRMCLLSRLSKTDQAVATFGEALDKGHWWSGTMLRDSDLYPLRGLPEWEILLERCRDLEAKTPPPDPDPVVVPPAATGSGDERTLVVLHGAGSRPELETEHWRAATETGWTIVAPQSTQRLSAAGRYGWHDLERAKADVMTQLEEAGYLSEGDLVIGGFSQGAGLAAHIACGADVPSAGLILVGPTFHWGMPKAPASDGSVASVIFLGKEDHPRIAEGVESLSEAIRGVDWPLTVHLLEGVGHAYPPDFHDRLTRALGWIETTSAESA